ncbi:hypothetical protein, partial [Novosphingobium sp. SCN 63-17]|uniref:hypothetical protein n=1 Tax=Novosphingobium sp. SCN 63-17 TaxID=1660120 RepID=UPI00086EFF5A
INGLLTWRARRLRSLRLKEGDVATIEADIAAIDRVLVNVIGFDGDIDAITRDFRREAMFRRGELQRAVATALREANEPLTARQITERVLAGKGYAMRPGRDSKQWITRVRKVCHKLPLKTMRPDDGCMAWGIRR